MAKRLIYSPENGEFQYFHMGSDTTFPMLGGSINNEGSGIKRVELGCYPNKRSPNYLEEFSS